MTTRVARSCVIDAPVGVVSRLLRDFNSHADWHPAIAESHIEAGEPPDLVGAVRAFLLADGGFLREQLIALSDRDMSLTYCLLEAPLRLDGYLATLQLKPVTDGDRTFVQWESRFDAPAAEVAARSAENRVHDPKPGTPTAAARRLPTRSASGRGGRVLRGDGDRG